MQKLAAVQAISREEYETKLTNLRTASAKVESSNAAVNARALDVSFTPVRAPVFGALSDLYAAGV